MECVNCKTKAVGHRTDTDKIKFYCPVCRTDHLVLRIGRKHTRIELFHPDGMNIFDDDEFIPDDYEIEV